MRWLRRMDCHLPPWSARVPKHMEQVASATMLCWTNQPWQRDSNQIASEELGAVHRGKLDLPQASPRSVEEGNFGKTDIDRAGRNCNCKQLGGGAGI